jgi:hypothetical protein
MLFDWNLFNGIILLWIVFVLGRQGIQQIHQCKMIMELGSMLSEAMDFLGVPHPDCTCDKCLMESIPTADYPKEKNPDEWKKWEDS